MHACMHASAASSFSPACTTVCREQVSSRSLVFDPVGDASQPLLRFPYKHIARLSKCVRVCRVSLAPLILDRDSTCATQSLRRTHPRTHNGTFLLLLRSRYTPSAGEAAEYGGDGSSGAAEGLFLFSCSSLLEMKADDLVCGGVGGPDQGSQWSSSSAFGWLVD